MADWNHKPTHYRPILPMTQRPGCSSEQWTPAVKVHTPLNSWSAGLNQDKVGKRLYKEISESNMKRFQPVAQSNRVVPVPSNLPPPVDASSCSTPTSCQAKSSTSLACEITVNTKDLVCKYFPSLREPFFRLSKIQFLCIPREICIYILRKDTSRKERELLIDYLARKTEICAAFNGRRCNICNVTTNGRSKNASKNLTNINLKMAIFRKKNPQVIALMEVTGMEVDAGSLDSNNTVQTGQKHMTNSNSGAAFPGGKEQLTHKATTLMKLPKSVSNVSDGRVSPNSTEQKGDQVHAKANCFAVLSESIGGSGDIEGKIFVFSCGLVTFKTFELKDGKDDLEITTMEFDKDGWNKMCAAGRPNH